MGLSGWELAAAPSAADAAQPRYDAWKDGARIWGHGFGHKVALTFDDGPNYQTTPRLLDHLDAAGVKATFFVNSQRFTARNALARKNLRVLHEIHRRGHLIGNHTYSHPALPTLPAGKQARQILRTDADIRRHLGLKTYLFRPPFGAMSAFARRLLRREGMTIVMWNLGSGDTKPGHFNTAKVVQTTMRKLVRKGGGIVLMHDTNYWTIEAVPPLLQAIRIEGCKRLAAGDEPYEIVGLRHFYVRRGGKPGVRTAAEEGAWRKRRAAIVKRCQTRARVPLPAFLRGGTP